LARQARGLEQREAVLSSAHFVTILAAGSYAVTLAKLGCDEEA